MDEKNMKDDGRSFVEEKMELEVKWIGVENLNSREVRLTLEEVLDLNTWRSFNLRRALEQVCWNNFGSNTLIHSKPKNKYTSLLFRGEETFKASFPNPNPRPSRRIIHEKVNKL